MIHDKQIKKLIDDLKIIEQRGIEVTTKGVITMLKGLLSKNVTPKKLPKAYKLGDPVVCTWGYNIATNKPYSFLYEFGYISRTGNHVVYNKGERNMQDSHSFTPQQVRMATKQDLKIKFWGN